MDAISRFLTPGKDHYFLFGSRNTGKTFWCAENYSNALRIDLLNAPTLRSQAEVDFVVYGEAGFYAMEVKNTRQVRPEDLRALKSFANDYPEARRFLVYRGNERLLRDGILCMPAEEFLLGLKPDRFAV